MSKPPPAGGADQSDQLKPAGKKIPSTKSQYPKRDKSRFGIGALKLEFVWNLVLGI
jgi:hypothetical protein